jgi:hypothetical protein
MPRPLSTPGKDPVPLVQEAGWAPGPVWTGAENLAPHRDLFFIFHFLFFLAKAFQKNIVISVNMADFFMIKWMCVITW